MKENRGGQFAPEIKWSLSTGFRWSLSPDFTLNVCTIDENDAFWANLVRSGFRSIDKICANISKEGFVFLVSSFFVIEVMNGRK